MNIELLYNIILFLGTPFLQFPNDYYSNSANISLLSIIMAATKNQLLSLSSS